MSRSMVGRVALGVWVLFFIACAPQSPAPEAAASDPEETLAQGFLEAPQHLVDLTHSFGPDTIYWPTDTEGFVLDSLAAGFTEKGYYYAANRFSCAEHGGTHIDAPIHFAEGRSTVDTIALERLVGPGIVVDVTEGAAKDPDYLVSISDLQAWEAKHGELPAGTIVLLRTGYSQRWSDRAGYLGTDKTGPEAVADLHFPGLHPEAAKWLVAERDIAAIGLDTPSIDTGQSTLYESHVALFAAEIPAFENVANLGRLPEKGFLVVALPMKIAGGSGAPLRIIAMW